MIEAQILRDHRVCRTTTALLTTYRRDGRAVSTIVSVLAHEGRFYFVSPVDSGKVKRDAWPSRGFLLNPWRPLLPSWALFRIRRHRMQFFAVQPSDSAAAP